jgi:hypothetical protein
MSRRPSWWSQVILAVGFAWGYDALRALHGNVQAVAVRNGRDVLRIDDDMHAGWVATLSGWIAHHDSLSDLLAGYYVVMHLGVVALTLVILWVNGTRYRWHRDALLLVSAMSFVVFWFYPVAPPRLIGAGFPDTVRHVLPFAYRTEAAAANLYAAVPSLHVAWALWVTIALFTISRRWWVRTLAVAHTALTVVTVLGTGNHYLFDVITGAAVTGFGYLVLPGLVAAVRSIDPRLVRTVVLTSAWPPPRLLPVASEPATIDLVGAQVHERERRGADRR